MNFKNTPTEENPVESRRWKIVVKDEDTGEWRDAEDSDGLDANNDYANRGDAESDMRHMVRRCAYNFPAKVVRQ